jgi:phage baseplate assembly protein W
VSAVGDVLGRGIAFPPGVGPDGRVAWSEGEANVREAMQIVLKTDRNERLRLPEFGGGLPRFSFEPNTAATHQQVAEEIRKALATWEPRIAIQAVDVTEDPADPESAIATVLFRLVATQATERVTLSVPVGG